MVGFNLVKIVFGGRDVKKRGSLDVDLSEGQRVRAW